MKLVLTRALYISILILILGCSSRAPQNSTANSVATDLLNPPMRVAADSIFFESSSYVVDRQYEGIIREKARLLKGRPTLQAEVQGHCDRSNTTEYAFSLAEQRAVSVAAMLAAAGAPADRVHTISFGKEFPLDLGVTPESVARNSRVQIVLYDPAAAK